MTTYVRKLVSGDKARFRDEELNLDLDLVYVTDQLIVMGFPAEGLEGLYRNRREDAKTFLDHRHRDNYWIFNFCPLTENSYDAAVFNGRVSRYPFPDHHAPPLAILALAAREIRSWLRGSSDRVAVLHCKAGKGRSGTVACAYLLSLDISPRPPQLRRSYTIKQWAKMRADEWMDVVETDDMPKYENTPDPEAMDTNIQVESPSDVTVSGLSRAASVLTSNASTFESTTLNGMPPGSHLERVLALHTSRRMKSPSRSSSSSSKPSPRKPKQGVSIPSQRRFLLYWSLFLSQTAPTHFWSLASNSVSARPKVKLLQMTVRLREIGRTELTLFKIINKVLEKTKGSKRRVGNYGQDLGNLWVSLARYDDDFVEVLEGWEKQTRDNSSTVQKADSHRDGHKQIFEDGRWDKGKMIRCSAILGRVQRQIEVQADENSRIYTHVLTPLNQNRWTIIQKSIKENSPQATLDVPATLRDENDDVSVETVQTSASDDGIILDAAREVRAKLYLGQVFMGWLWFIPTFHMSQPPPHVSDDVPPPTHFRLSRKDVDFPLGIGAWIIDIDIEMAWVPVDSEVSSMSPTSYEQ